MRDTQRDEQLVGELAAKWRTDLGSWAIPQEILDQAEVPPWVHPVQMFTVDGEIADSPSHAAARSGLEPGGSVLDIGCGGGRAALALVPPAGTVIGVDHQQGMLEAFADAALRRGAVHHEYLGDWPDVADDVPECDVVVCHHVAFNVPDIVPFIEALDAHARRRVVIELPMRHPQSAFNDLWLQFWGLHRPTSPTADDLRDLIAALGHEVHVQRWHDPDFGSRSDLDAAERARFTCTRLCLPPERAPEVAAAMALTEPGGRELVTLWWDTSRAN